MTKKIYDNSNLAESYAGVTTPLTYSFARRVYQGVYESFCRMMGVNKKTIAQRKELFSNMVELVGYRMYYNLLNWYQMIALFPGYKFSREFMEKMMGVEKGLEEDRSAKDDHSSLSYRYLPKTLFHLIHITITFSLLKYRIKRFNRYFDYFYSRINEIKLEQLNLKELKELYFTLDHKLISRWRVPIANDFAVMVSSGLADKLFKQWLRSDSAYDHMETSIKQPLVSLDPGLELQKIAVKIKNDPDLFEMFTEISADEIWAELSRRYKDHPITRDIFNYLDRFGDRSPNELKLESSNLRENPTDIIDLLKAFMCQASLDEGSEKKEWSKSSADFSELNWLKRSFLNWLLKWSGNSIRRREETRFRRTLIFGYVRKLFLAIGRKMEAANTLRSHNDIFFLTVEEVFGWIDDQAQHSNLAVKADERRGSYNLWRSISMPRRIETELTVEDWMEEYLHEPPETQARTLTKVKGTVASHPEGFEYIRGRALTLKEFDASAEFQNKILFTIQTDPGWTTIFPLLKAVVVERGGMLSHAAIVARELNIPCLVGVKGVTDVIQSGHEVELDLQSGEVRYN